MGRSYGETGWSKITKITWAYYVGGIRRGFVTKHLLGQPPRVCQFQARANNKDFIEHAAVTTTSRNEARRWVEVTVRLMDATENK